MEKIKVGDYVRTKDGEITRIVDTNMFDKTIYKDIQGVKYYLEDIVKHSPNIINLIEVGDYVNGNKVFATDNRINDNGEKVILTENYDEWTDNGVISNKDIKSIVTKEQFKSVSYEV